MSVFFFVFFLFVFDFFRHIVNKEVRRLSCSERMRGNFRLRPMRENTKKDEALQTKKGAAFAVSAKAFCFVKDSSYFFMTINDFICRFTTRQERKENYDEFF